MTPSQIGADWAPRLLSILRIMAAILFLSHGVQKLFGFPAPPSFGLPAMGSLLWFAAVIEIVGGVMLLVGFLTRPVAFLLSGQMAFAYFIAHATRGTYPIANGGELAIVYCFLFLYVAAAGPGPWSVDATMGRRSPVSRWA